MTTSIVARHPDQVAPAHRPSTHGTDTVATLVVAARAGDPAAWEALIKQCEPLVSAMTRRYRLPPADAADATQIVWLKLLDHVHELHEPRALIGWLKTVARRVCLDAVTTQRRTTPLDPQVLSVSIDGLGPTPHGRGTTADALEEDLERHDCGVAIREGLAELAPAQRRLLLLLAADPPPSYAMISRQLGLPVGSIGPTRARSLTKLRNTEAVRRFVEAR